MSRLLVAAVALALSGLGAVGPARAADVLVVDESWIPGNPWQMASDDAYVGARAGCYEGLTRVDESGRMTPWLALSFRRLAPTVWEFALRPGVRFQDGAPLDADSVTLALDHLLREAVPARAFSTRLIAAVEPAGPMAVRITTREPLAVLPAHLASPATAILSPAAFRGDGVDPVGHCTGPFAITAVEPGVGLSVHANPDYWGGAPALAEARIRFVPNGTSRAADVASGAADIARLVPTASFSTLRRTPGLDLREVPAPRLTLLVLNNGSGPLADARLRGAVAAAIDREAISDGLYDGLMPPAAGLFRPGEPWGLPADEAQPDAAAQFRQPDLADLDAGRGPGPSPYDPARARLLLSEAGIAPRHLRLRLLAYSERSDFPDLATTIRDALAEVGIAVEIEIGTYAGLEPDLLAGHFDLALLSRGYLTDVAEPIGFLAADFACGGSYNLAHVCRPEIDEALRRARADDDPERRFALYREVAGIVVHESVVVPIVHETTFDAVSARVEGAVSHPLNYTTLTPATQLR
ncbi:ABC transporter substrate-binding protein [Aureimonas sp. AU12]|uniref:ABC transporter substrate-binding protein n=1 Tax=Aureimonas sp. AU12 TaxID=1638161 RepID=UPI0007855CF8|nr:ABC transporter substrate-binding protein [Aureimonas sp. AU12]